MHRVPRRRHHHRWLGGPSFSRRLALSLCIGLLRCILRVGQVRCLNADGGRAAILSAAACHCEGAAILCA
eukprot:4899574-Prorocentrum_lima.AAC.1